MPVTVPQVVGILIPSLASSSMLGVGVPKFSQGLAVGLSTWTPTIVVNTTDVGTAGAGKGVPVPVVIPQPLLYGNLIAGMVSQGLTGVMSPAFILGLSNGLVLVYAQALTNTAHVGVGTGSGVTTFRPPPAFSFLQAGFASVGMVGEGGLKLARALSRGLESTFRTIIGVQPIVGPSAPSAGSGRGFGNIV